MKRENSNQTWNKVKVKRTKWNEQKGKKKNDLQGTEGAYYKI